jgi:hypothetical protein
MDEACNAIYAVLDNAIFGRIGIDDAKAQIGMIMMQHHSDMQGEMETEQLSRDMKAGSSDPGYLGDDFSLDLQSAIAPLGNKVNQS